MKHSLKINIILISIFFISQIIGLAITNSYINHKLLVETGKVEFISLPYNIERPPLEQKSSFVFIFLAIIIGTILMLIIIRFKKSIFWKVWFFLAVTLCLSVAFSAFLNQYIAFPLAIIFGWYKIFKQNKIIQNLTELFIYGGLAAIFVPVINLFAAFVLLILISIYDFIAVLKIKHMVTLAKFQTKENIFAGISIPYEKTEKPTAIKEIKAEKTKKEKIKTAILGGGDMGFPLLFAGVVMKNLMKENTILLGFLKALIIPVFASIALFLLLILAKKDKFYPAMPFLTAGCFLGYGIILLLNFV